MKGIKTGGRKKGTKNIYQTESKKIIESFLLDNYGQMQKCFDVLEPKEKLTFLFKFSEFICSKGSDAIELTDDQVNTIIEKLKNELQHG